MKNRHMAALILCGVLQSGAIASAGVLYSDNFNRSSANLGSTSTGGVAWIENENNSFAYWVDGTKLNINGGGGESSAKSGLAYVNYNLDSVVNYEIDFTFTVGAGAVTNTAWTIVRPRGGTGTTTDSSGWLFRKNASGNVNISFWDASALTETVVASDAFTAATATSVVILVNGNSATLKIGSWTDTRTLNHAANDGTADYFGFSDTSYSRAYVDDLTVTSVPEISSLGIFGGIGSLFYLRRRAAK